MPSGSAAEIAANFVEFAVKRLQMSQRDILRCVDQLSEEQLWQRGGDHENSIANLLLHLAGNMRQWVLHGIAGEPDVRQRDEEFALTPELTAAEARAGFEATLAKVCGVLATVEPDRLMQRINPQPGSPWGEVTILAAIFQVVGHVQLHTGQIILLTKQMLARDLDLSMPRKRPV
jgi:uncharacterized damage-inducible protein DinB